MVWLGVIGHLSEGVYTMLTLSVAVMAFGIIGSLWCWIILEAEADRLALRIGGRLYDVASRHGGASVKGVV